MVSTADRILVFIKAYKKRWGGTSPTLQEISDATGGLSKSTVNYHLDDLEIRGEISRPKRKTARMILVKDETWSCPE